MARDVTDATTIERRDELVAWLEKGNKRPDQFRVGTEHEKVPFYKAGHAPVPYAGPRGVRALLEGMQGLLGWEPIMEGETIIGLLDVTGGGAISLEPGGQFELSGAPVQTIHQTCSELNAHLAQIKEIGLPNPAEAKREVQASKAKASASGGGSTKTATKPSGQKTTTTTSSSSGSAARPSREAPSAANRSKSKKKRK